jgi:hypothetical protein
MDIAADRGGGRKLNLHRETLHRLANEQIAIVGGGAGHTFAIVTSCMTTNACGTAAGCGGTNSCGGCGNSLAGTCTLQIAGCCTNTCG